MNDIQKEKQNKKNEPLLASLTRNRGLNAYYIVEEREGETPTLRDRERRMTRQQFDDATDGGSTFFKACDDMDRQKSTSVIEHMDNAVILTRLSADELAKALEKTELTGYVPVLKLDDQGKKPAFSQRVIKNKPSEHCLIVREINSYQMSTLIKLVGEDRAQFNPFNKTVYVSFENENDLHGFMDKYFKMLDGRKQPVSQAATRDGPFVRVFFDRASALVKPKETAEMKDTRRARQANAARRKSPQDEPRQDWLRASMAQEREEKARNNMATDSEAQLKQKLKELQQEMDSRMKEMEEKLRRFTVDVVQYSEKTMEHTSARMDSLEQGVANQINSLFERIMKVNEERANKDFEKMKRIVRTVARDEVTRSMGMDESSSENDSEDKVPARPAPRPPAASTPKQPTKPRSPVKVKSPSAQPSKVGFFTRRSNKTTRKNNSGGKNAATPRGRSESFDRGAQGEGGSDRATKAPKMAIAQPLAAHDVDHHH